MAEPPAGLLPGAQCVRDAPLHRRQFLRLAAVAVTMCAGVAAAGDTVRIGWRAEGGDAGALPDGARFGIDEASRTAALLGRRLDVVTGADAYAEGLSLAPTAAASRAAGVVLDVGGAAGAAVGGSTLSVSAAERAYLDAVVGYAARTGHASRAYLVVPASAEGDRRAAAAREALVGRLDVAGATTLGERDDGAALRDAVATSGADLALVLLRRPGLAGLLSRLADRCTTAVPFSDGLDVPVHANLLRATLWHHTVERSGGAQVNERFRRSFGRPMTGVDWAGWFGAKAAWESLSRDGTGGVGLYQALASGAMRFDGHKGHPLAFARDGHLQQPLFVVGIADGGDEAVLETTA